MHFMDNMGAEKTHLRGCVHFVHNVHFVHQVVKPNWLQLPSSGSFSPCNRHENVILLIE